jgi:hypothetical protein
MTDHYHHGAAKKTGQRHGSEHEHHDPWGHYAHYAHEAHIAAEGIEFAVHSLHHAIEYVKHVQAAATLLKTHGQMAYDLRRMARGIAKLENVAKEGGARGVKAAQQLNKARPALRAAQSEFEAERAAVRAANEALREFKLLQRGIAANAADAKVLATLKAAALVKLGEAAAKLETSLAASRVGSKLLTVGRIISSKTFVRSLVIVGSALEAVASYMDSTARTTGGKVFNTALGAGGGALTMANPWVAIADWAAPNGYKLSEVYHGGAGAVTAFTEGWLTHDTRAMDEFHKRSMQGHYGKVMQAASEAGVYWAEKGIPGGLSGFVHDFSFIEFFHAVNWWTNIDFTRVPRLGGDRDYIGHNI